MNLEWLQQELDNQMENYAHSPHLEKLLTPGFVDKRIYAMYLTETYHYTFHNSRHQALVATRRDNTNINYLKYCLNHALEETGHELMALHDLNALGYNVKKEDLPRPLNSTTILSSYLYEISLQHHPVARLGYSYWAERSYEYIAPLMSLITDKLAIQKAATTFFTEHAEIDEKHASDVQQAIERFVKTEEEWLAVRDALVTSLKLTVDMMNEVLEQFVQLKEGKDVRYKFL